jgi:hypothetical protein
MVRLAKFDDVFEPEWLSFCKNRYCDFHECLKWYSDLGGVVKHHQDIQDIDEIEEVQDETSQEDTDQEEEDADRGAKSCRDKGVAQEDESKFDFTPSELAAIAVSGDVAQFRYLKECFRDDALVVCFGLTKAMCAYDDDDLRDVLRYATSSALDANKELVKQVACLLKDFAFPNMLGMKAYQEVYQHVMTHVWECITPQVDKALLTKEVALGLTSKDGRALQKLPHFDNDFDVVLQASKNTCQALQFCSKELRDNASIVRAGMLSNKGLDWLKLASPSALVINRDLFVQVVRHEPLTCLLFKHDQDYQMLVDLGISLAPNLIHSLSKEDQSIERVLACAAKDYLVLFQGGLEAFCNNEQIVLAGARQNGACMKFLPDNDQVFKSCLLAEQDAHKALEFATKGVVKRNQLLLEGLLSQHLELLQQLDVADLADLMCVMSIKDPRFFKLVPESHMNLGFVVNMVSKNPRVFKYARGFRDNQQVARLAIAKYGLNLKHTLFVDRDVVLSAVKQNGMALQFAGTLIQDKQVVTIAVNQNGTALQFAGSYTQDKDVVLTAVMQHGMALQFAPTFKTDLDVCQRAYNSNKYAYDFIDSSLQHLFETPRRFECEVTLSACSFFLTSEERNKLEVDARAKQYLDNLHYGTTW